jgi:type I restriction enzyme S subunit
MSCDANSPESIELGWLIRENIAELQTGPFGTMLKAKEYVSNGIPIIAVKDIGDGVIIHGSSPMITNDDASRLKRYKLESDDIAFGRKGAVDRRALITKAEEGWLQGSDCIRLRVNKKSVDPEYLFYCFGSKDYVNWIKHHANGTTMPSLNQDILSRVPLKMYPLPEQRAIVRILSSLDDKIELNNRMNKTLEEIAQTLFKRWFVDYEFPDENGNPYKSSGGNMVDSELGMIPEGWKVVELNSIFNFSKGKKPVDIHNSKGELLSKYLTIDVLNGGNPQYASPDKMILAEVYDVLMVMDGASSGSLYYGLDGIVASTLAKLNIHNKDYIELIYLFLKMNEMDIRLHHTGSAIPHTDKAYVLQYKIALPRDRNLKYICDLYKNFRATTINNNSQNGILSQLRDTLLPKLMSGEIRVPITEE